MDTIYICENCQNFLINIISTDCNFVTMRCEYLQHDAETGKKQSLWTQILNIFFLYVTTIQEKTSEISTNKQIPKYTKSADV